VREDMRNWIGRVEREFRRWIEWESRR